jgi:hypothetical protein
MRLLNARTFQLREFFELEVQPYAIISHRWGDNDLTFRDVESQTWLEKINGDTPSSKKIKGCCRQALKDELEWVWIDTCCINKLSSEELSMSINSMYQWYQKAAVCYVHMSDVVASGPMPPRTNKEEFCKSKWFTRGWTLQELIAPPYVEFYSSEWIELGTRLSLSNWIRGVTGINENVLTYRRPIFDITIGERMSWAANRETTREEDKAYCLLGIFGINMPLLYGEGTKAFFRLQQEIFQQQEDYTLLCWCLDIVGRLRSNGREWGGVLATSASHFESLCFRVNTDIKEDSCSDLDSLESFPSSQDSLESFSSSQDSARSVSYNSQQPQCIWVTEWGNIDCTVAQLRKLHLSMEAMAEDMASALSQSQDPPQFTSRGLKMSLFVKETQHYPRGYLAWTWCCLDHNDTKWLICLRLQENLRFREESCLLELVPTPEIGSFHLKETFLDVSNSRSLAYPPPRGISVSEGSYLKVHHDCKQLELQAAIRFILRQQPNIGEINGKTNIPSRPFQGGTLFQLDFLTYDGVLDFCPETGGWEVNIDGCRDPVLVLIFTVRDSNILFPLTILFPKGTGLPLENFYCILEEFPEGSNYLELAAKWRSRLYQGQWAYQDRLVKHINKNHAVLVKVKQAGERRTIVLELINT